MKPHNTELLSILLFSLIAGTTLGAIVGYMLNPLFDLVLFDQINRKITFPLFYILFTGILVIISSLLGTYFPAKMASEADVVKELRAL